VRSYPMSLNDLKKTMKFLRERQEQYYLIHRLMLEERSAYLILLIKNYWSSEMVKIKR
jgi:hypothetical protein